MDLASRMLRFMANPTKTNKAPSPELNHLNASPASLERLPPEIKAEILRQCADIPTLRNLVRASYRYHQAYKPICQTIYSKVLLRQLAARGYDVQGMAFENFKSEFILGGARRGVSEIEASHQYACDNRSGKPSFKHSLSIPLVTSVLERTVIWDGDCQTTYRRCNAHGYRSKDDINRALGWLIREGLHDAQANVPAPVGRYQALEVILNEEPGYIPPGERRELLQRLAAGNDVQGPSTSAPSHFRNGKFRAIRYILLRPYKVPNTPSAPDE